MRTPRRSGDVHPERKTQNLSGRASRTHVGGLLERLWCSEGLLLFWLRSSRTQGPTGSGAIYSKRSAGLVWLVNNRPESQLGSRKLLLQRSWPNRGEKHQKDSCAPDLQAKY